jgi:hypothetical protein
MASNKSGIQLLGAAATLAAFKLLPDQASTATVKGINAAAGELAQTMTTQARSKWAGVDTGELQQKGAHVLAVATVAKPFAVVGFPRSVWYAHFWEYGVRKRPAIPVMRPAVDRSQSESVQPKVGAELRKLVSVVPYLSIRGAG